MILLDEGLNHSIIGCSRGMRGTMRGEGEDEQGFARTLFVRRSARGAHRDFQPKFGAIVDASQHRDDRKVDYKH